MAEEKKRRGRPPNSTTKKKLTPYEEQMVEAVKKVKDYKLACEANIVSIFYKQSDLLFDSDLSLEDFSNNIWKVYWQIAHDVAVKEHKPVLDEVTVGLYLEKHDKLKAQYDDNGGYETIEKALEYVEIQNFDGYVKDLKKWNVVLQLLVRRFPVADKLSEFADMSLEQIYAQYEATLNHIFISTDTDVESYDIGDGIYDLIEELDKGFAVGLPFDGLPLLSKETGGNLSGNITLVCALSNVGKSSFVRNTLVPSIIKADEKLTIMLNEEDKKKTQRELMVWVANNIYNKDLQKYIVRDGKYATDTKELLYECAKWISDRKDIITVLPFKHYKTESAIKVIKKYANLGYNYHVLDTFKADKGNISDRIWLEMAQNMTNLYDTIKEANKNVHFTATLQLAKASAKQRFYTQENIGVSKSVIDVASTCIMLRDVFEDEYDGGKNELRVYKLEGKNGKTKIPVKLNPDKHYVLCFVVKNREGSANQRQIVVEVDWSRNIMKEVGFTSVPVDF